MSENSSYDLSTSENLSGNSDEFERAVSRHEDKTMLNSLKRALDRANRLQQEIKDLRQRCAHVAVDFKTTERRVAQTEKLVSQVKEDWRPMQAVLEQDEYLGNMLETLERQGESIRLGVFPIENWALWRLVHATYPRSGATFENPRLPGRKTKSD